MLGGEQERGLRAGTINVPGDRRLRRRGPGGAAHLASSDEQVRWRDAAQRGWSGGGDRRFGAGGHAEEHLCFGDADGFASDRGGT
jgi:hypothetical protein